MSIPTNLNVHDLNARLNNAERCDELAPAGRYAQLRDAVQIVHDASNGLLEALRAAGLKSRNSDSLRVVEAVIYGYIAGSSPDAYELVTGEGFGQYADHPQAGERVRDGAARDQAAMQRLRAGGAR